MSMANDRPSRKRPIAKCDDSQCDFTPLSKRINNLHLTRPSGAPDEFNGQAKPEDLHNHHHNHHHSNGIVNGYGGHMDQPGPSHQYQHQPHELQQQQQHQQHHPTTPWVTQDMMSQYAPTIDPADSPFYYEHNKLLFALHLERVHRLPQNNNNNQPFS